MSLTPKELSLLNNDFLLAVEKADNGTLLDMLIRIAGAAYHQELTQFRGRDRTLAQLKYISSLVHERMQHGRRTSGKTAKKKN